MPTVREEMVRHRQEMEAGTLERRGPVMVEALQRDADPLVKRTREVAPRVWSTQRIVAEEIDDAASRPIQRMMALQKRVSDDSQVFDLVKGGENDSPNICIGRAQRNDVVIEDDTVSSQHAVLEHGEDNLIIRDSNSSNGTWVNRRPLTSSEEVPLKSGDSIRLGGCGFYFLSGGQFALFLKLRLQNTDA